MQIIELTQGKVAIVSDCDYEYLNQWKWYYSNIGYAVRSTHPGTIGMHRVVLERMLGPFDGEVDHIGGDSLNNRRTNLRLATKSQNQINSGPYKNNKSGYKGVCWHKATNKWHSSISTQGQRRHLGIFENKLDAAKAYNKAAKKYFGAFAWLNPIPGE